MPDSAVGLFEDASTTESVVDTLRAHGFPTKGIQVVTQAQLSPAPGGTGPGVADGFAVLERGLCTMGLGATERSWLAEGIRRGHALLLATGTRAQAEMAVEIMNEYAPMAMEEMAGAAMSSAHDGRSKDEASGGVRLLRW